MSFRVRTDCRLCGGEALSRVFELPPTPLANEFPTEPCPGQETFPLWLSACDACGHVQLPVAVDPDRLFRNYVYVSGTSPAFVAHFERYVDSVFPLLRFSMLGPESIHPPLVVEVGSNDGTMLRIFKNFHCRTLGIDPARDLAQKATDSGVETWPEFLSAEVADRVVAQRGAARLVVANNVFAHADDLYGFAAAVKRMLEPGGSFVFEVGYLVDVLKKTLVDNIYHEHVSFHHVAPLVPFFAKLGMSLIDAERVDTHGGSVRVRVVNGNWMPVDDRARVLMAEEWAAGLGDPREIQKTFAAFSKQIAERRTMLGTLLAEYASAGKKIAAYGAPAKATTLLRALNIDLALIDFVVDDNPLKQGRYLPGSSIPVLTSSAIGDRRPDVLVLLAWNFVEPILTKLAPYRAAGGSVIVPLPTLRVF